MGAPKRIRKIEYDRIDRVDAGAQPGAHVTLVKRRTKISKVIDPASIDAKVQAVRSEFWEQYNRQGCCYDCSGYVYVDAVYDGFLIGCDDDNTYWRIPYTLGANNTVTFDAPEAVMPTVSWTSDATADDADAPVPMSKALWARAHEGDPVFLSKAEAAKFKSITKETDMPAIKKTETTTAPDIDLSGLDDETRKQVEATIAENAALKAAAETAPEVEVDDDAEDLETIAGLQKALSRSKSPEMKRLLKATLTRLEKSETLAAESQEQTARLMKAERVRLFKERAKAVQHMTPHAATEDEKDGVIALAKMLETIDEKAGSDVAEAVEAVLTKAHTQVHGLLDGKGLLKSVGRSGGTEAGNAQIIGTSDDPEAELDHLAAELKKSDPTLSDAQARTRVLKSRHDLYAASASQAR